MILLPILGLLGLWFVLSNDLAPSPPIEAPAVPAPAGVTDVQAAASPGETPVDQPFAPIAPQAREPAPQPEEPWLPAAVALLERARQDPELTVVRARIERIGKPYGGERNPTAPVRLRILQPDLRHELRRGGRVDTVFSPAIADHQFHAATPIAALAVGDTRDFVLAFQAPKWLRGLRTDRWIVVCGPRLPDEPPEGAPTPDVPEAMRRFANAPDTWVVHGRLRAITDAPVRVLRVAVSAVASGDDSVTAGTDVEVYDLFTALQPQTRRRLDVSQIGEPRWLVFGKVGSRYVLQAWSDALR
ncbi:MAG: hypothetical protein IPK26_28585 [Planctomycetes bacterium]|nr:hypothetical protein [Planctomycetota bacterium]